MNKVLTTFINPLFQLDENEFEKNTYRFLEELDKLENFKKNNELKTGLELSNRLRQLVDLDLNQLNGKTFIDLANRFMLIFKQAVTDQSATHYHLKINEYFSIIEPGLKPITAPFNLLPIVFKFVAVQLRLMTPINTPLYGSFGLKCAIPILTIKQLTYYFNNVLLQKKIKAIYEKAIILWHQENQKEIEDVYEWSYYYDTIYTDLERQKKELYKNKQKNNSQIKKIKAQLKHLRQQREYFREVVYHPNYLLNF